MKYRPQRGLLAEAMLEVREFDGSREQLQLLLPNGFTLVSVNPYTYDDRIGWDTHIVIAEWQDGDWVQQGAIGYTDGPLKEQT